MYHFAKSPVLSALGLCTVFIYSSTHAALPIDTKIEMHGVGMIDTLKVGWKTENSYISIDAQGNISGYIDIDGVDSRITVCGAGEISGRLNGQRLVATFISEDPDLGCSFEHGLARTIEGMLFDADTKVHGRYLVGNGQSGRFIVNLVPERNAQVLSENTLYQYQGVGLNQAFEQALLIPTFTLKKQGNSVNGSLDVDELAGENPMCTAGDYLGVLNGPSLMFSLSSADPDPGCGFDRDAPVLAQATLSDNAQVIDGNFSFNGQQAGIFSVVRTTESPSGDNTPTPSVHPTNNDAQPSSSSGGGGGGGAIGFGGLLLGLIGVFRVRKRPEQSITKK